MLQLPRALRALVVCVVTLLAANAAVVVTRLGDAVGQPAVALDAPTDVAVVDDTVVREVVIITTADGRQLAVDPSTPEGQAAIADAIARGDDVETRTVSVPAPDRTGGDGDDVSQAGAPLSQSVLDAVLKGGDGSAVLVGPSTSVPGGGAPVLPTTVPGAPLDDALDAAEDLVGEVNDVVEDTRSTVNDVLEDVTEVVDDVTDGTTVSVPGVPVTVTTPPVTTPPVTVVVTTPPVTVTVPVVTTVVTVPPTTVVTVPPTTVVVTVPPVTVTVPPVTVAPVTVPTTLPGGLLG